MSLSWRERHILVLGSARAALYRQRRGDCVLLDDCPLDGAVAPLAAVLQAGEQLLAACPRGSRVEVVLSNRFARFCLVPWSWDIDSPSEQQTLARHCLEEIYGEAVDGWQVRISPEAGGCMRLAAAIPEALLDGVRAQCTARGARLVSLQPYQMAAFNRFRRQLGQGDFLFILVEPGRCMLLLAQAGAWARVRSLGVDDAPESLALLLGRELELLEARESVPRDVYLHAPGYPAGLTIDGATPRPLQLGVAANDALHAMALAMLEA